MLWLMELRAIEALPEITQPAHKAGVSFFLLEIAGPMPRVLCQTCHAGDRVGVGGRESRLEALSWRQRQVIAPASGCQGMRLRSGTKAGLGERRAGPATEVPGSQPHTRDSGAKEPLRNPEPAKLKGATPPRKSSPEVRDSQSLSLCPTAFQLTEHFPVLSPTWSPQPSGGGW